MRSTVTAGWGLRSFKMRSEWSTLQLPKWPVTRALGLPGPQYSCSDWVRRGNSLGTECHWAQSWTLVTASALPSPCFKIFNNGYRQQYLGTGVRVERTWRGGAIRRKVSEEKFPKRRSWEKKLAQKEVLVVVKSVRHFCHGLQDSIAVVRSGQSFLHWLF